MTRLYILGAGQHGRIVRDTARRAGMTVGGIYDDRQSPGTEIGDVTVIASIVIGSK